MAQQGKKLMFQTLWQKFRDFWLTDVPPEIAACEFDCREIDCPTQDIQTCPGRQQKELGIKNAAGSFLIENSSEKNNCN